MTTSVEVAESCESVTAYGLFSMTGGYRLRMTVTVTMFGPVVLGGTPLSLAYTLSYWTFYGGRENSDRVAKRKK